jgi:hypothetical protein
MEQSVSLIGHGLGWSLDTIVHDRQPVIARRALRGAVG